MEHQEDSQILLEQIMPQIAAQLRGAMGNIHTALTRLVPEEMPEGEGSTGQSAAILCQSYYRLLRLVNNLSAAPLISQTEPLETKNVELVAWLTELMHCAQPLVAHAGVRLTLRCSLTAHVAAIHPSYLERLLWNLLSNAVKYTPSGGEVTVTLRAAAGQVLLTVADSGVGIPPEQQAHLFDGYLEKLRMPPPPQGLGLGLPLCQAIARGHGGRLLLQSGPEGTTVTVSLPDRRCTKTVLREPPFAYGGGFHPVLLGLAGMAVPAGGAAGAGGCAALYGLHPEKSGLTAPHMILGSPLWRERIHEETVHGEKTSSGGHVRRSGQLGGGASIAAAGLRLRRGHAEAVQRRGGGYLLLR